MTFKELIQEATVAANGQNKLGRAVGGSHNIVRQWLMGMSLPSTTEQEEAIGKLVRRPQAEVHEIIWLERRRRWEAKRGNGNADRRFSTKPPAMVRTGRLMRGRELVTAGAR